MNTSKKSARLAILIPILWLVLFAGASMTSCVSSASAQEKADITPAELDSLTSAYYLLQFDFDLYKAKAESGDKMDQLRYERMDAAWVERVSELKAYHKRTIWTILISALSAGVLFWVGTGLD